MARRRVVRTDGPALDERVRDDVRAAGERDRRGQRLGRGFGVRARVEQDLCLDLHQPPVGVRVMAVAQQRRVAVGVAEEGLLAGGGQLDRAAGAQGEQAERKLEAGVLAVAGRAGDTRDDDLHPLRFEAEAGGGEVAVGVRVGGGGVDLHSAVGAGHGESGLGTDRGRVLAADAVQALDDDLAGDVRVPVAQRDVADQIAVGVQRFGGEGLLRVGDRFEDLVLDGDGRGGEPGRVGVVGGDRGDRLAVVADQVGREDRAVDDPAAVRALPGDVLVRDDGPYARHLDGGRGVDGQDPGVRVRGAEDRRPEQALGPEVGRVREGALGLGARVGGRQRDAEAECGRLGVGALGHRGGDPCAGRVGSGGCVVAHAMPPSCGCDWTLPAPGAAWCGMRASSGSGDVESDEAGSMVASRPAMTSLTASRTPR